MKSDYIVDTEWKGADGTEVVTKSGHVGHIYSTFDAALKALNAAPNATLITGKGWYGDNVEEKEE